MSKARTTKDEKAPRDRIVAAAADLFARKGIDGTPLREIARLAGTNVNLISYYFPSKAELFDAVIDDLANELNVERGKMLDDLEEQHSPNPIPVESIIHSLIDPIFKLHKKDPKIWGDWIRLLNRETGSPHWRQAMERGLRPIMRRYIHLLHRTMPKASRDELRFSLELALLSVQIILEGDIDVIWADQKNATTSRRALEKRMLIALTAATKAFS